MSAIDKEPFPRGALIGAAVLVAFSLATAGYGSYMKRTSPPPAQVETAPAEALSLSFIDEASGAVSVRDHATGALVITLQPGEDAFIRGVLRSLVRERRARGIDRAPPFRLAQWANGALIIEDPSTGRRINLRAFGATNSQAFVRILDARRSRG